MYAIIESSGKQYRVTPGQTLKIDLQAKSVGEQIKFDKVLLVGGKEDSVMVGAPYVASAAVEGEVLDHPRGKKLLIIKYRRRKGFRKTQGHRQEHTLVLITKLSDGKGGVTEYDSSKRSELLMKANVATAKKTEKKPAAKATASAKPAAAKAKTTAKKPSTKKA